MKRAASQSWTRLDERLPHTPGTNSPVPQADQVRQCSKQRLLSSTLPDAPLTMAPLSDDYTLTVRQGPERAKLASVKEKGERRRPRLVSSVLTPTREETRGSASHRPTLYQRPSRSSAVSYLRCFVRGNAQMLPIGITCKARISSCASTCAKPSQQKQNHSLPREFCRAPWCPRFIGSRT